MCGLVGVAGHSTMPSEKALRDLLMVDVVRGAHSTGVMFLSNNGVPSVVKKAGPPSELFDSKKFHVEFGKFNALMMGHNRWATTGKINATNAHPFEFEDVFGAHNGTLRQQSLLPDHREFEVDSENIFHSIQEDGFDVTVGKLNGAYALTWYDKRDNTLNFSRNKERTLFHCTSKDKKQLFWASEAWMLFGVLARQGIQHGKVVLFEPDLHYSYDMAALSKGYNTTVPKPRVSKAVGYTPPKVVPVAGKWAGKGVVQQRKKFHVVGDTVGFTVTNKPVVNNYRVHVEGKTDKGEDVAVWLSEAQAVEARVFDIGVNLTGTICSQPMNVGARSTITAATLEVQTMELLGYRGEVLSEHEWRRRTKSGCAWCSDVADETIEWLSASEFLCNNCQMDEELGGMIVQ